MISKSDFENWKLDPVTKAFFEAAEERIEDAKDILSTSAGVNPDEDNFFRGFIHAYREMQEFRVDFEEDLE